VSACATFDEHIAEHLAGRGFSRRRCAACTRTFFCRAGFAAAGCQGEDCPGPRLARVPRPPLASSEVWLRIQAHFCGLGYRASVMPSVIPRHGEPLFVVAGLQCFDEALYGGQPFPRGRIVLGQPCIRMRYLSAVGGKEHFLTSFVNVCTEQANTTMAEYLASLDDWIACLSHLRLPSSRTTIVAPSVPWSGGPFGGRTLLFTAEGVEIGDAIFITRAPGAGPGFAIADFSFGLERVTSVVNGSGGAYAEIGQITQYLERDYVTTDAIRTLVLMLGCGVRAKDGRRGHELRRVARRLVSRRAIDLGPLVRDAYAHWNQFLPLKTDAAEVERVLGEEVRRIRNADLYRRLGLRPHPERLAMPFEELCALLMAGGLSLDQIEMAYDDGSSPRP
jgi:hypothetical protein